MIRRLLIVDSRVASHDRADILIVTSPTVFELKGKTSMPSTVCFVDVDVFESEKIARPATTSAVTEETEPFMRLPN